VPLEGAYVHHAGGDDYEVEAALGARARYVDVASPTDQ
jgi:hypothetical protein